MEDAESINNWFLTFVKSVTSQIWTPEFAVKLYLTTKPDPTSNDLNCFIGISNTKGWFYSLTGVDGKLVRDESINSPEFKIERKSLSDGIYFLKIVDEKKQAVKTLKIVFQ